MAKVRPAELLRFKTVGRDRMERTVQLATFLHRSPAADSREFHQSFYIVTRRKYGKLARQNAHENSARRPDIES